MRRILLASLAVLLPSPASAYSVSLAQGNKGPVVRWLVTQVEYRIHPSGSADVVDESDIAAVKQGFAQWTAVDCSAMVFTYAGTTSAKLNMAVGGAPNDVNEVMWAEGPEWTHGQYVLGLTSTSFGADSGELFEADIAFNGYLNKWSTTGKAGTVDVLNVAVHEEGHFFGAQHVLSGFSAVDPPTMAPTADPDLKSQSLEPDDESCICYLYPKGEYYCSVDADCPYIVDQDPYTGEELYVGKVMCKSGLCGGVSAQVPEGTKVLGEECASDFDCKKPLFCQPTGAGEAHCAKTCKSDGDCGTGFLCYPYSDAAGGVCLPFSGPAPASKSNGEPCEYSEECKSGLCVGTDVAAYCRKPCKLGGSECPAGETCAQLQGASNGACLPSQGSSGTKPPGAPCSSPSECVSGLCVSSGGSTYHCRESCTPQLGDCPDLHECFSLVGGGGACFPVDPKKDLGEPCQYSNDCLSDLCLSIEGKTGAFCSQPCGECPCGMECAPFAGGKSYCVAGGPTACVPSGNPCESAAECISGNCSGGICRDSCQVTKSQCPPGQGCRRAKPGSTVGICTEKGGTALAQPCGSDIDCSSLLCEGGICVAPCDPDTSYCGDGMVCQLPPGGAITICSEAPRGRDGGDGAGVEDAAEGGTGVDGGQAGSEDAGGHGPGRSRASGEHAGTDGAASGCSSGRPRRRSVPALPWLLLAVLLWMGSMRWIGWPTGRRRASGPRARQREP